MNKKLGAILLTIAGVTIVLASTINTYISDRDIFVPGTVEAGTLKASVLQISDNFTYRGKNIDIYTWDLIAEKLIVINKGDTQQTVTETSPTLKGEVCADYHYIIFPDAVHVVANNPGASYVNLTFEIKALLDDGSEVSIATETLVNGTTWDDWLIHFLDKIPNGRKVVCIRLYANVSGTPTAGAEPTVQLERVIGLQI